MYENTPFEDYITEVSEDAENDYLNSYEYLSQYD
jgi:hypothetical protein